MAEFSLADGFRCLACGRLWPSWAKWATCRKSHNAFGGDIAAPAARTPHRRRGDDDMTEDYSDTPEGQDALAADMAALDPRMIEANRRANAAVGVVSDRLREIEERGESAIAHVEGWAHTLSLRPLRSGLEAEEAVNALLRLAADHRVLLAELASARAQLEQQEAVLRKWQAFFSAGYLAGQPFESTAAIIAQEGWEALAVPAARTPEEGVSADIPAWLFR